MLADIQRMVYSEEVNHQLHVMAQARESSPVIDRRFNQCATPPSLCVPYIFMHFIRNVFKFALNTRKKLDRIMKDIDKLPIFHFSPMRYRYIERNNTETADTDTTRSRYFWYNDPTLHCWSLWRTRCGSLWVGRVWQSDEIQTLHVTRSHQWGSYHEIITATR